MKTGSKTRSGITYEPDPEPARVTPETSVLRASSESSLNLTVLLDNGEAGVELPGHPVVRATTTYPGTTLVEQARDAAENDPVRETEYHSERRRTPTLVSCSGPCVSSGVGQVPTLISDRRGVSVGEVVASAPISRTVGTPVDRENVLPRMHKSLSQFEMLMMNIFTMNMQFVVTCCMFVT